MNERNEDWIGITSTGVPVMRERRECGEGGRCLFDEGACIWCGAPQPAAPRSIEQKPREQ